MFKETPKKITSLHHPLVKHLVKIRDNKHYRQACQSVLVPGIKLVKEVAQTIKPKVVFAAEISPDLNISPTHIVSVEILKKVTGLVSPEGIVAEFPLPSSTSLAGKSFVLVLDQVADPGNMGTLLRTGLALGWEGAFLLPGCVDPFNEKVIRSSRGACFRFPFQLVTWDLIESMAEKDAIPILVADLEGIPLHELTVALVKAYLVLSNEARGVSLDLKKTKIQIPMPGPMESLNVAVAGGILMYTLKYRNL